MLYETEEEYTEAITETQAAIKRILTTGTSREIGASEASTKIRDENLRTLREHLQILQTEKRAFSDQYTGNSITLVGGY